ncbi:MAG: 2,3-bisphosphoglycerate-independent phosphoglycerate mutase [Deltaproteobacteria bacterium]|nr:MAG: 2,3-bisphosphoglycerate-independent phosphoglycerate mutase [Deltaproteobacteria bacterium]
MTQWKLSPHKAFGGVPGPVVWVVMDGVGNGPGDAGDAVHLSRTPTLDWLGENALTTQLVAHGKAVGLPDDGDMGNSEVGHNALGAGRVFDQGAKRVNAALASGELYEGAVWKGLTGRVRESGEPMHFIGLLSDGNVHSHIDHLFQMIRRCHDEDVAAVRVHVLLDGRDVPDGSATAYVDQLEGLLADLCAEGRDYRIASGGGRMKVTMDRYEAEWSMVERGWQLHVRGEGRGFPSAAQAIQTFRDEDKKATDQNLPGFVVVDGEGKAVGPIRDGAAVVFFNFRGDRAIEITKAFEDEAFPAFDRGPRPDVLYAGMMQYDGDLLLPKQYLVDPPAIDRTLGEFLVHNGVTQLATSETQKFGHVTYFWNGNRSGYFDEKMERYVEIKSDVLPFEERPWMKAAEITDVVVDALTNGRERHIRLNYANGDMVGHTGALDAAVLAVESVDLCLGRLVPLVRELGGALIVTADHGNADEMFLRDKKSGEALRGADGVPLPKTSHTLSPVPLHIYAPTAPSLALNSDVKRPGISNLASTCLALLGLSAPEDYDASLIG